MATSGSGSKEPETPRETLLVCRETVPQSNQRNSPCWWELTSELKKRSKLNNSLFMCSCPPFSWLVASPFPSPTLSFPLSSDCESTDVFLTIQSFSSPLKTFERFSRRKRALTFAASPLCCALGTSPNCLSIWVYTQTASPPNHNSPRGDRNLVFVVGLSPRAALSPVLLWVNGITSNTKPTMWCEPAKWIWKNHIEPNGQSSDNTSKWSVVNKKTLPT